MTFSLTKQTCKNFAELARRGYYNGVIFHRVIPVCSFTLTLRGLFALTRTLTDLGVHGAERGPYRDRKGRNEHLRPEVVSCFGLLGGPISFMALEL